MTRPSDEAILDLYEKLGRNKAATARQLGLPRTTVWKIVNRHNLPPKPAPKVEMPEPEPEHHRELRAAEAKIAKLEQTLQREHARRRTAENDLEELQRLNNIFEDLESQDLHYRRLTPLDLERSRTKGGCTAIICANDWHLEKNIESSTVSGLNEFNLEVAADRISNLWRRALKLITMWDTIGKVDEVVIWLGGDLMNNYLHDEDVEGNFLGPTEAILHLEEHIISGIEFIRSKLPLHRVVCNYGNHARTTQRNRPATGWKTSWEYLAYKHLERRYMGEIDFEIPNGYMNYQPIQGHIVRFHHGENVRYWGGVGGLAIPMNKAISQWNKGRPVSFSISGHFHQYLPHGFDWVSCGCLCGYDAFAQSIKADYQPPTQTVVFVDKERGPVGVLPIFLED